MKPRKIFESGIFFWVEDCARLNDDRYASLSIVGATQEQLLPYLNKLIPGDEGYHRQWFRCRTSGQISHLNSITRKKLMKAHAEDVGNFHNLKASLADDIICSVAKVSQPLEKIDLEILSDYRRELLIGRSELVASSDDVLSIMAPFVEFFDPRYVEKLIAEGFMAARFDSDPDTHSCFQWFGNTKDVQLLDAELDRLKILTLESRYELP